MHRIKLAAKLVATAAILIALFRIADTHRVMDALRNVSLEWLLLVYPISLLARTIQASMLQSVLRCVGERLSIRRIFFAGALSGFWGLLAPGEVLASFAKWKSLSDATGRKSLVLSAVVYNRLLLLLVPLAAGFAALWWRNPVPHLPLAGISAVLLGVAIVATGALFHPRFGSVVDRLTRRATDPLPAFLARRIGYLLDSLALVRSIPPAAHARHLLLSAARMTMVLGSTKVLLLSLGFDVPIEALVLLQAVLQIVLQFPVTVGSFGVREAVYMGVLGEYGVAQADALAAGLLAYTTRFAFALIGGFYQIALVLDWADSRSR